MNGKKQIERSVVVDADVPAVWEVLADSRLLPRWAPVVDDVTACAPGGEAVGEVRHCTARLAGRSGRMVERCVELVPHRRIAYVVDEESFGMRRMFDDYGFALELEPMPGGRSRVTLHTHYTPRNTIYALMNATLMRGRFAAVCEQLLGGLRSFVEAERQAANDVANRSRRAKV
jgi:uncharacterized protein YndB with AHSA1/START domain